MGAGCRALFEALLSAVSTLLRHLAQDQEFQFLVPELRVEENCQERALQVPGVEFPLRDWYVVEFYCILIFNGLLLYNDDACISSSEFFDAFS